MRGGFVREGGPTDQPTPSRTKLFALIAGLGLVGVAAAVFAGRLPGAPNSGSADTVALVLLLVLAAFLGLEFRARGEGDRLDLFDAAVAAALVSLPAPELLALVVLAKALALTVQRVEPIKICFNIAQWGCAAAVGGLVFAGLRTPGPATGRDLLALAAAMIVVAAINAGAVQLVLAVVGARAPRPDSPYRVRGVFVGGLASLSLALMGGGVWALVPTARPVIPVALVALHLGGRLWAQRQVGASRLVGLERASGALAGPHDLPTALPLFLSELRQAFDCAGVELHLRPFPDAPWTRITSGYDSGDERTAALVDELVRRGSALRVAPPEGDQVLHSLLADAGWRDCLAVPVCRGGEQIGLLCSHDREGWEGFELGELAVLEAAAGVLGEAVQRGELADVLVAERAALRSSEIRWRAVARVLELVALGTPLAETLDELARTLEEQMTHARCAVLIRTPGEAPAVAAPNLPASAVSALQEVLMPTLSGWPPLSEMWVHDLTHRPLDWISDRAHGVLHSAGVDLLQVWPLPCSPDSGAAGVLALCFPTETMLPEDPSLVDAAVRVGGLALDHLLVRDRLAHQAGHDALTDLPNRSVFLDRLGRALRSTDRDGTSVLVLFLDIDRFKIVNDSMGHRAGDALLCAVAARLRAAVRPGDTVARFGGDEFTILCEDIEDEAHALQVVQRVQAELSEPFPLGEGELFATSSIGIALGRGSAQAPETLVEDADAAMYRAKERGGNSFELFDDAMRERAVRRLSTQSAMHRALEREEFRVVYQPTVRLTTGELDGVEALVRWDRPAHGVVMPGNFVPLAEESGLIVPIGAYVLNEACRQAREWQTSRMDDPTPSISINLSARQLTDPGLVPLVEAALERHAVDARAISLEITETGLMSDVAASSVVLSELKELGVRLYVDDFGTGHSSLTYLQRFPVDGIKVDRSFVAGLASRRDDAAIVRSVIALAHGLGLVAVAEGVETGEQLDRLIDLDCDIAQGYYLGRPVSGDLVALDLREQRAAQLVSGRLQPDQSLRRSG